MLRIDKNQINLMTIIASEMLMHAGQYHTSFPFLVLITEMCKCAGVPQDTKKDIEVIHTSSTNVRIIQVEYNKDQAEKKQNEAHVDHSPAIDKHSLLVEVSLSTMDVNRSRISTVVAIPSNTSNSPTTTFPPKFASIFFSSSDYPVFITSNGTTFPYCLSLSC